MRALMALVVTSTLALPLSLSVLAPSIGWQLTCAAPALTKEDCTEAGRVRATSRSQALRALRDPLGSSSRALSGLFVLATQPSAVR
ncbi:MAG: hypothetical protein JNM69_08475 [Archangium sp.]|nr:hypothetical protein [Archangium sp.]